MPGTYATITQLLQRTNARRIAQLAIATSDDMQPVDLVVAALHDQLDPQQHTADTLASLQAAVGRVQGALEDAAAYISAYNIPAPGDLGAEVPEHIARINCMLAYIYLRQYAGEIVEESETETLQRPLIQHAKGLISLLPEDHAAGADLGGSITIQSAPARYAAAATATINRINSIGSNIGSNNNGSNA